MIGARRAMRYVRRIEQQPSSPLWLITFADLLLQLLAAFVMRLSMGTWKDVRIDPEILRRQEALKLREQYAKGLADYMRAGLELPLMLPPKQEVPKFVVQARSEGIEIKLSGASFAPASREISPALQMVLERIAAAVQQWPVQVIVEGHTDPVPIHTPEYPSNWELSAARAISVAEAFTALGVAGERIAAVGYADTRPVADNAAEEGRAQNRRVSIQLRMEAKYFLAPAR